MNEYRIVIKQNKQLIVGSLLGFLLFFVLLFFFVSYFSASFQKKVLEHLTFQQGSFQVSDTNLDYGVRLFSIQLFLIVAWSGLVQLYTQSFRKSSYLFGVLSIVLIVSLVVTHLAVPYCEAYFANHTLDESIVNEKFSLGDFCLVEFIIWIMVNAFVLPIYFVVVDKKKSILISNDHLVVVGFVLFLAGILTPSPDILSQLLLSSLLALVWILGYLVSKIISTRYEKALPSASRKLYFYLCGSFLLLSIFLVEANLPSLFESIVVILGLLTVQFILTVVFIYKTDKLSGTLALLVPFYLPYYIFKNSKKHFGNKLYYKVFAVLVAKVTLVQLVLMVVKVR